MQINFAQLRERAQSGGYIDFAIFEAKSSFECDRDKDVLLSQLTQAARRQGLKVDQSALAYRSGSRTQYYGDKPLVQHLSRRGLRGWTHTLTV